MEEDKKQKDNSQSESPEVEELKGRLAKCEVERDDYLNGWKRAKADLINYKKDEAKRFEELIQFGSSDLIKDLIPVLDSFDLALAVLEKEGKRENGSTELTTKGIYMIRSQIEDVLKKRGFERMTVSVGGEFDPNLHESVGEIESVHPPGSIVLEIERGYLLNGRVIRPARVKLSKLTTNN